MACSVEITEVTGLAFSSNGDITILMVRGAASDCKEVCVSVHQDLPIVHTTPVKTVPVENNGTGNWSAQFSEDAGDFPKGTFLCGPGNKFGVFAYCCDNPDCAAQGWDYPEAIACGDCPEVSDYAEVEIAGGPCIDGLRSVTVSAVITPGGSGSAYVQWLNDEGIGQVGGVISAPDTLYEKTINYPPGEHTARLVVIDPEGCGEFVTDPFTIAACEPDEEEEPDCGPYRVTGITVSEGACSGQVRSYTATAICEPSETPTSFEWEWSDGFSEVTQTNQSVHGLPAAQEAAGYVAVVGVWANGCTYLATQSLTITACEAPDCSDYRVEVEVEVGGCHTGQRLVTATAGVQAPLPSTQYQWLWWDGQNQATTTPETSRTFVAGDGFDGSVSVLVSWPNGCQASASDTFRVRDCRPDPPPVDPPPPVDLCLIWFYANVVLMLITGAMIFITACMISATVWAAIAALASGGTLGAVWAAMTAADIVLLSITAALIVITLVSLIAWVVICAFGRRRDDACRLISWLIDILSFLTAISFIIGIILALAGQGGCAIGGIIDAAWFGVLLAIAWWVARALGCRLS